MDGGCCLLLEGVTVRRKGTLEPWGRMGLGQGSAVKSTALPNWILCLPPCQANEALVLLPWAAICSREGKAGCAGQPRSL